MPFCWSASGRPHRRLRQAAAPRQVPRHSRSRPRRASHRRPLTRRRERRPAAAQALHPPRSQPTRAVPRARPPRAARPPRRAELRPRPPRTCPATPVPPSPARRLRRRPQRLPQLTTATRLRLGVTSRRQTTGPRPRALTSHGCCRTPVRCWGSQARQRSRRTQPTAVGCFCFSLPSRSSSLSLPARRCCGDSERCGAIGEPAKECQ